MARPKLTAPRDRHVSFRINAEEHFKLLAKAHTSGMSVGDYVRSQALSDRAVRSPLPRVVLTADVGTDVVHHLRKIGVNINQIARHCHQTKLPPPPNLDPLLAELRALLNRAWSGREDVAK